MLAAHEVGDAVIVVRIVETLAKLVAVGFEATLVGIITAVLGAADVALVGPEVLILSAKYLILAQLAVERAIEERQAHTGLKANLIEQLLARRDHPRFAAHELMFEALAQRPVKPEQVGRHEALPVGRIGHHQGGLGRLRELLQGAARHADAVRHTRTLGVGYRGVDGGLIEVVPIYFMVELAFLGVVVVNTVEQVAVEIAPLLESERLAEDAGIDVARNKGGLDEQGAGPAHRVDEVGGPVPARELQDAGGEHLVDRRVDRGAAIATTMKALARRIQRERTIGITDMNVQLYIRVCDSYVRAFPGALAEIIDDGILHLVGDELGMAKVLRIDDGVDGKRSIEVEVTAPVDFLHGGVDLVGIAGLEVFYRLEYAHGGAQAEIGTVHHFLVAGERDHAPPDLYIVGSEFRQFLCQNFFKSLESFGDEFELFFHDYCFAFFRCISRSPGATSSVTHKLPPIVAPRPMVMRPRMVALE